MMADTADNGAPAGSVILLFGTGLGQVPASLATGWLSGFPALALSTERQSWPSEPCRRPSSFPSGPGVCGAVARFRAWPGVGK